MLRKQIGQFCLSLGPIWGAGQPSVDLLDHWPREAWTPSNPALINDDFSSSPQRMLPPSPPIVPAGRGVAVVAVCEQESSDYFLLINCLCVSYFDSSCVSHVGIVPQGYLTPSSQLHSWDSEVQ